MSKQDFTEFDGALLAFIGMHGAAFGTTAGTLCATQHIIELAEKHAIKTKWSTAAMVVGQRLQVLRKAGRVEYRRKTGWHLVMEG